MKNANADVVIIGSHDTAFYSWSNKEANTLLNNL